MNNNMLFKMTVRFYAADHKVFGPGIAQLLHRVQEYHSLRAAALSMDMAYSKAWTIIKNSEKALGFSLLDSTTGGKGGGGAALTPEGARLLRAYDTFCSRLHDAADELFQEEFAPFL